MKKYKSGPRYVWNVAKGQLEDTHSDGWKYSSWKNDRVERLDAVEPHTESDDPRYLSPEDKKDILQSIPVSPMVEKKKGEKTIQEMVAEIYDVIGKPELLELRKQELLEIKKELKKLKEEKLEIEKKLKGKDKTPKHQPKSGPQNYKTPRDKFKIIPNERIIKKGKDFFAKRPKPPIIEYMDLQDAINEIDPYWWIEDPEDKPSADDKARLNYERLKRLERNRRESEGIENILKLNKHRLET